jgi:hypothetical protein
MHRPVGFADGDPALIELDSRLAINRAGAHPPRDGIIERVLLAVTGDIRKAG